MRPFTAWYTVVVLMLVSIIGYMDRLVMSFLLDPIKADLDLSDTELGVLTGFAFALFYVVMGLPLGYLIDRGNRKAILSICIALWSAMTGACGAAMNFLWLFVARMGVASGEAALNPAAVSMIGDLFPPKKVALAVSVFTLGIYIGGGLAIIVGGQLVEFFSNLGAIDIAGFEDVSAWRLVFVATGMPGILVALLMYFTVGEPRRLLIARREEGSGGLQPEGRAFLKAHWTLYASFYGALFTFGFYIYAVLGWYPAMLMRTYGAAPGDAALGFGSVYLVFGVAGALSVGPMLKWIERRGVRESAVVLCLVGLAAMAGPSVAGPLMPSLFLCLVCFAVTKFFWASSITVAFAAIAQITPSSMRGIMTSVFMALMNVTGGAFGAVLAGLMSDHLFGPENIRYALSLMAGIFIPAGVVLFALARPAYRRRLAEIGA